MADKKIPGTAALLERFDAATDRAEDTAKKVAAAEAALIAAQKENDVAVAAANQAHAELTSALQARTQLFNAASGRIRQFGT